MTEMLGEADLGTKSANLRHFNFILSEVKCKWAEIAVVANWTKRLPEAFPPYSCVDNNDMA